MNKPKVTVVRANIRNASLRHTNHGWQFKYRTIYNTTLLRLDFPPSSINQVVNWISFIFPEMRGGIWWEGGTILLGV